MMCWCRHKDHNIRSIGCVAAKCTVLNSAPRSSELSWTKSHWWCNTIMSPHFCGARGGYRFLRDTHPDPVQSTQCQDIPALMETLTAHHQWSCVPKLMPHWCNVRGTPLAHEWNDLTWAGWKTFLFIVSLHFPDLVPADMKPTQCCCFFSQNGSHSTKWSLTMS